MCDCMFKCIGVCVCVHSSVSVYHGRIFVILDLSKSVADPLKIAALTFLNDFVIVFFLTLLVNKS